MQPCKTVLYFLYSNPCYYPPLEHSARLLAENGFRVVILGTRGEGPCGFRFSALHSNIRIRLLAICSPGFRQKLHYARFAVWVFWWTLRLRPRWVYASDTLACPIALWLSFLPNVSVVYHEHDSPDAIPVTVINKVLHWCRRNLARRAAASVLPSHKRADRFAQATDMQRRPICVLNCPSLAELSARAGHRDDKALQVYFHGSIVPARVPVALVRALAGLPENVRLCIVGYETRGSAGYVDQLRKLAGELGVDNRLQFPGTFPTRADLLDVCSRQDVGIAFMPMMAASIDEETMAGASNKAFDYLACGLPVLVSDRPEWRTGLVDPGYALSCDSSNPNSIASALQWFLDHPDERRRMGKEGRQRILEEWNYECQFAPVLAIMRGEI